MEKEQMWKKLDNLVKVITHRAPDWYYTQKQIYKDIDAIYESNKEMTVDILYTMALDVDQSNEWDNFNVMDILYYLLKKYKRNNDIKYLEDKYRDMLKIIFEDETHVNCRKFLGTLLTEGFNKNERLELFKKYLKTETDPINVQVYKYNILRHEVVGAFPERGFLSIIGALESNDPSDDTVMETQKTIDILIKKRGKEIVSKYLKTYLNHRYAKEESKVVLRQIKINRDDLLI